MDEAPDQAHDGVEAMGSNVFALRFSPRPTRQPQLSDAELIRLRRMMDNFDLVAATCPMAKRILEERAP